METTSVGEVLDNTQDIGIPAGHIIAGEWVDINFRISTNCVDVYLPKALCLCRYKQQLCAPCPCRYLLPHLGSLVDIPILVDLKEIIGDEE